MSWAIYGATGYTGQLIAETAVAKGHRPLLLGRNEMKLAALAARLNLNYRAVALEDSVALNIALEGQKVVVHAAGPFLKTFQPMVEACLNQKVHYLDITGEPDVFQAIYALDSRASNHKVALIPGVGFDVIPSNCLSAYVASKVPSAKKLEFAMAVIGRPSPGTLKSALSVGTLGPRVFRDGKPKRWPWGRGMRRIQFSQREAWGLVVPVSDVDAAYRATSIPDITAYFAIPSSAAIPIRMLGGVTSAALPLVRQALKLFDVDALIDKNAVERSPDLRARGRSHLWARAEAEGQAFEAWLDAPEGYAFTAEAAVRSVEKVLASKLKGALTPSQAFGADFILEIPGCVRKDAPA